MAVSLGIHYVDLVNPMYKKAVQLELLGHLRESNFEVRQLSSNYRQGFELWEIEQERKVEQSIIVSIRSEDGRFCEQRVNEFLVPETLKAYYLREEQLFFISGNSRQRDTAYKRLSEILSVRRPLIDLEGVIKRTEDLTKISIERNDPRGRKVAVGGNDLKNDGLVRYLLEEEEGNINSVVVYFTIGGVAHKLGINSIGGIRLFGKYDDIDQVLHIMREFYMKVVKEVLNV